MLERIAKPNPLDLNVIESISTKCNICHNKFYKTVNGSPYCNCPSGLKWS